MHMCTCACTHARTHTHTHTHTHTDNQKQSIFRKWSTYSRPNKLDLNSRWEKPCCFQPWKQKFTGSETIFPPRTAVCAVRVFATLWTVARQAPLSMGFFRQDYWSGLPCPPPGDLPNWETESASLLHWQAGSLPLAPPWEATFRGLLFLIVTSFPVRPHRRDVWGVKGGWKVHMFIQTLMCIVLEWRSVVSFGGMDWSIKHDHCS